MFSELTTPERQRVAQAYMPQMGGRSPADVGTMVQQLLTNNDLAARAMEHYNSLSGGNANDAGMRSQGGLESLMSSMTAQDGTPDASATTSAPLPPRRTANVPQQVSNAPIPPTKPTEFSGEDRVAKAGGPGSTGRTSASTQPPSEIAENSVDSSYSSDILKVLAALGLGGGGLYALGKMGMKQLPAEANVETPIETSKAMTTMQPKVLPPEAGGAVVPAQDRFAQAFGDDITDAEYREVAPKQIDTQKKLAGPKETDDRDNVKKADGKTIVGEDETPDAGVKRTMNKATTVKEKLKPKVRVK